MTRRAVVLLALSLGPQAAPVPAEVRVGVFGLFHPQELVVSAAGGVVSLAGDQHSCVLRAGEEARVEAPPAAASERSESSRREWGWGPTSKNIRQGGSVRVACAAAVFSTRAVRITGPTGQSADLQLSVPGRITRRFHGRLDVILDGSELVPVVSMDLETAVASVVAAEQIGSTPPEALKAQAVAARSFFIAARRRHGGFGFCDTTHCQFLREPPAADHPAARAARETAGLVLTFRGAPFPAFYSASCGGRTRTLADAGLEDADGYPYFSVECGRHHAAGDRNGHGIGMCQKGAASLAAERGASFAEILQHYYPVTTLEVRQP
jgi:hypothetical protein